MAEVVVGPITYTKRLNTPKRRGHPVGHDWIRAVPGASAATGRSVASQEVAVLVDEVVRLRDALSSASTLAERILRSRDDRMHDDQWDDVDTTFYEPGEDLAEAVLAALSGGVYG